MECVTITNSEADAIAEAEKKLKSSDSAENFQHFIYELFEKNGILNDLRAYLRGHIVDVLKNAQTGEPPTCQKHFTQRLDLTNQSLNMLVAEYLLRYEFSYSLSVFISEIPLANMVFNLAKSLMMQSDCGDHSKLWFTDSDVWSVLNYLGIKCDSVHASNIVEKYNSKESPLLLCILKSLPFYCKEDISHEQEYSSLESNISEKSSESSPAKKTKHQKIYRHEKCKHFAYCKACQSRLHSVKEKFVKKKKHLAKNLNMPPENTKKIKNIVKNVSFAEKALVDEMFLQLKSVYETEVEMVKQEQDKKYKQVLATYAMQLQKRQNEMEEKFKQREEELETAVSQKKKFLWGLAQALRDQHQNMAAAMSCVRGESERLSAKEDSLKSQLIEAENMIKNRGEEMRAQISNEIQVLEEHLESMKKERDNIDREKSELEKFKTLCDSKIKLINDDSKLEILQKEIVALRKFVEERKICVAEKCTMTNSESGGRMNNQDVRSDSEERVGRPPNRVVNDLKKQKNVNFNQPQFDPMYEENRRERIRSQSNEGLEEREARCDAILMLQDENERLIHFARQQEQHIDELSMQSARLRAELEARAATAGAARPRTAPAFPTPYQFQPKLNTSFSATYNPLAPSAGAGEDSLFPARNVPRHGAINDRRRANSKRYLIQQWRALRHVSPTNSSREAVTQPHRHSMPTASAQNAAHSVDSEPMRETADDNNYTEQVDQENIEQPMPEVASESSKARCKSPKSMLKEAKMKLRNKVNIPRNHSHLKREKSPNSVLREAKLRLRKLEIEAEAVEKSYLDFRKRQTMREETRCHYVTVDGVCDDVTLDANDDTSNLQKCKMDLDKFLNRYEKKFKANSHYRNRSPNSKARVIPESYVELDKKNLKRKDNTYLETPLTEFRKLYSQQPCKLEESKANHTIDEFFRSKNNDKQQIEHKKDVKNKNKEPQKSNKEELQILKENINKMYNLKEPSESEVKKIEEGKEDESKNPGNKNILRIEIESVTETNHVKLKEYDAQDMLLVVQSPAETTNISQSDVGDELPPRMTVLVSPKIRNLTEESESQIQPSHTHIVDLEPEKLNPGSLDTLFHIENDVEDVKSAPVEPHGGSQDILDSLSDKPDVYVDDFSADVDNYNSRSEYGDNSPVSHLKTSEDENFWDS